MSDRIDRAVEFRKLVPPLGCEHAHWFAMGECRVAVAVEYGLWHMSISCRDRDPTWDEIATARYRLVPDNKVTMAMLLPPLVEYVNLHEHVFHLHEIEGQP